MANNEAMTPEEEQMVINCLASGGTMRDAGRVVDRHYNTVKRWVWRYEEKTGKRLQRMRRGHGRTPREARLDAVDTSGDRCRCGLRLPCHGCVPSIYHFATARREAA